MIEAGAAVSSVVLLNNNKIVFMVDKDLVSNEIIKDEIYRTDTYSFENILVNNTSLSKMWRYGIYKGATGIYFITVKRNLSTYGRDL